MTSDQNVVLVDVLQAYHDLGQEMSMLIDLLEGHQISVNHSLLGYTATTSGIAAIKRLKAAAVTVRALRVLVVQSRWYKESIK